MALDGEGRLVFVNTLFSCLATLSESHSFAPSWRPPFVSRLAAEDRCHMNGLAMREGEPAYVTAVSESDVADGWRERRQDGGAARAWRAWPEWRGAVRESDAPDARDAPALPDARSLWAGAAVCADV